MNDLKKRFPLYTRVLRLYPKPYRDTYGQELLQTTADLLDDIPGRRERLALWLRIAAELPQSVTRQQLQYIGGTMQNEMPRYIKRNSLIAALMLFPFFAALSANALDQAVNHHPLYHSWLWRFPAIGVWLLYLPELAFALAAGSYLFYALKRPRGKTAGSSLKRLMNVRCIWPVAVPTLLAFGILFLVTFHDSGQCWVHTPSYLASHISQSWQCTVKSQSLPAFRHYL